MNLVPVRVSNAVSGRELFVAEYPRDVLLQRVRERLGSRPSRPVCVMRGTQVLGDQDELPDVSACLPVELTVTISDALSEKERQDLRRRLEHAAWHDALAFSQVMSPAVADDKSLMRVLARKIGALGIRQASAICQLDADVVAAASSPFRRSAHLPYRPPAEAVHFPLPLVADRR